MDAEDKRVIQDRFMGCVGQGEQTKAMLKFYASLKKGLCPSCGGLLRPYAESTSASERKDTLICVACGKKFCDGTLED